MTQPTDDVDESEQLSPRVVHNHYNQEKHGNGANRIVWAVCGALVIINVGALIGALSWFNMRLLELSATVAGLAATVAGLQASVAALIQRLP